MLCLSGHEQNQLRVLVAIVLLLGVIQLFSAPEKISLKDVVVSGKNQISISSNFDTTETRIIHVNQKRVEPNRVVINESPLEDLLICPGIGKKKAEKIILERKYKPFYDWRDLSDRVTSISKTQIEILKDAGVRLNSTEPMQ